MRTQKESSKYTGAGYPKHVIENTIKNFNRKKDELLILPWLFDERKHYYMCAVFLEE